MIVIYDNTGYIFLQGHGFPEPQGGVQFLNVEVPEGKKLSAINMNVTPHQPVFDDVPKGKLELLEEEIAALKANQAAMLSGIRE